MNDKSGKESFNAEYADKNCILCHGTGKVILKLVCFGSNPHREEGICSCVFLNQLKEKRKTLEKESLS